MKIIKKIFNAESESDKSSAQECEFKSWQIWRNGSFSIKSDHHDFNSSGLNCPDKWAGILTLASDKRKELQTDPFRSFAKNIIPSISLQVLND